jgi:RNA polymerase sigma-70 factor (ECF subfamily)
MEPALDSSETGREPSAEPASAIADLLVARARRRDPHAFEELYSQNRQRIYALALRLTRQARRAEELTQDAFVRAWEALPGFRGDSAFATWLHGLAVRVFLEQARAERRRTERIESAADLELYVDEIRRALPGTTATSLALEKAIAGLPDGARVPLVLYAVEGYTYEEIARLLGLALGTIKAQIHRARRLLKEILQS